MQCPVCQQQKKRPHICNMQNERSLPPACISAARPCFEGDAVHSGSPMRNLRLHRYLTWTDSPTVTIVHGLGRPQQPAQVMRLVIWQYERFRRSWAFVMATRHQKASSWSPGCISNCQRQTLSDTHAPRPRKFHRQIFRRCGCWQLASSSNFRGFATKVLPRLATVPPGQ